MKNYIKIVAIIAAIALVFLQYFLLTNIYRGWENILYKEIDESFELAVEEEAIIRHKNLLNSLSTGELSYKDSIELQGLIGINKLLDLYQIPINIDTLSKLFENNLAERELYDIEYSLTMVENDSSLFDTESFYDKEFSSSQHSLTKLYTHIVPISEEQNKGIRAEVENPYKVVLPKMRLLLIFSLIIIFTLVYCIYKISRMLGKLSQINKMRQDHTYAMIHDMKTPLSAISLISDDLQEYAERSNESDLAQDSKILKEEAEHLNNICNRVISVACLESKKLKFVLEEIDIDTLVTDITAKYIGGYKVVGVNKSVTITKDFHKERVVVADKLYLTEIIENLIDNSLKYSKESVKIDISTNLKSGKGLFSLPGLERLNLIPTNKYVEIHLKDNGLGISEKHKKRLFKKYERGENTVAISGHGLGLNYVYQLMKYIGGYVKIESKLDLYTEVILGFPKRD